MRKREFEIGNEKLLDVRPSDVLRLFNLNHTKNLATTTIRNEYEERRSKGDTRGWTGTSHDA